MRNTPLSIYQSRIDSGDYLPDPEQLKAAQLLDRLWHELLAPQKRAFWRSRGESTEARIKGVYLWGGVGRGKTWLMDLFFDSLPIGQKQRIHFHRFMARIHLGLREHEASQDPLAEVAREWSEACRLLCFDEFFVSDIADAMLLARLFEGLFEHGVVLVATSNIHPNDLYRDGLQRARFLPAIDLIKSHTRILQIDGQTDYRLRILEKSEIYHYPLDEGADHSLEQGFRSMSGGCELNSELDINGRLFRSRMRGDGIIWFDFDELCEKPRSTSDYIEISRSFNTVFISDIPHMGDENANAARRFINLVDEFYDRNVKLLISAAAPADNLYRGERLAFEFQRTASRLIEMQSHQYLAKPHLP